VAFDKIAYWANKGKKPEQPRGANTLVCSYCMTWTMSQPDPRARRAGALLAARGPFVKVPGGYRHEGCAHTGEKKWQE
jgi:hypothetical protein